MNWLSKPVRGLLLDITGVLYNSGEGDGVAIASSIEAVKRLQASDLKIRFVSNESSNTRAKLAAKLGRLGFEIQEEQLFTPAPAAASYLRQHGLRPHLLVHPGVQDEFAEFDMTDPNCVVMGDAEREFTYQNLNTAFQLLIKLDRPQLITLGYGKYYMETDGLKLDVGAYAKALEYACDIQSLVIGKPNAEYFSAAVADMQLTIDETVMIGDDILSDIGGAQKAGLRGVQVRTGKWRPQWENHPIVTPDGIVDNLAEAVNLLLAQNAA
uniref:Phospholysine phosphohistidine inorganic pyrophosphate phosphatase n=1 Tax=Plectus sambesii TaxID=2011161 RepID=A0A914UGR6_9BILA